MAFGKELALMTIYMEASDQGTEGIHAVAWVIANRVRSGKWGKTPGEVVLAPEQFSCWNTGNTNRIRMAKASGEDPIWGEIAMAFNEAMTYQPPSDPTGGAMYYFNPKLAKPSWAEHMKQTVTVKDHVFYREPSEK